MPHIDVLDSLLVVIDAQEGFYGPGRADVDRPALSEALARVAWTTGLAVALSVPVVVTEEDAATNGRSLPSVRQALGDEYRPFVKTVFGACDEPLIDAAVRRSGRSCVVLVGMETDVCVAHSAIGWRVAGLRVVVVHDAVFSAGRAHDFGLGRLGREGIELVSAKELYYEWLRDLPTVRAFDAAHPALTTPPGFSL